MPKNAFEWVEQTLSEAVMLVHPGPYAPTCVTVDALNMPVVLKQFIEDQLKPISFFHSSPGN